MFNGIFERRAFCTRARASERKSSRVARLFVSLLKNARAANILHLVLSILRISESKCLCCLPILGPCRRLVLSEVVPWPVIWSLARYHMSQVWYTGTRPRMEALVRDFQHFAAKVRWKWHFREEPRGFYIHLKNSRCTLPYPLVTPPELEGWLSVLRERMLMTARATLHNPGYNRVDPMFYHSPCMVGSVSRPAVGWPF